ncbi:hypothetical protein FRZ06_20065 [Anoxybacterium hadale]|uniref:Uncharacterized protein n=1 Tax=Anoxybacterium hadale TaxID=3408580 RepID=A0ACD1AH40_9FIRM|nr:hypothetical protein FRZ06_20065 [Clostridiales bacterium]
MKSNATALKSKKQIKKIILKSFCCLLAAALITGSTAGSVSAVEKDPSAEKFISNLGIEVTWFDFGPYNHYYISGDGSNTGFYRLEMSNGPSSKTAYVKGDGSLALPPMNYHSMRSSYSDGESVTIMNAENSHSIISSDKIISIDGTIYSDVSSFFQGYTSVTVKATSRKGILDQNGALVFEDKDGKYTDLIHIGSGIFAAKIKGEKYAFLDRAGTPLTEAIYSTDWSFMVSEESIAASKEGKYGYLDLSGKEITPFIYDDTLRFSEGLAPVCRDGKWGYIDKTGAEVIPLTYDSARYFSKGLAAVAVSDKWGLIDKAGNMILPLENDYLYEQENGLYLAQKGDTSSLLDSSGKPVKMTGDYSYVSYDGSSDGRFYAQKIKDGQEISAFLDKDENLLTGWKDFSLFYLSDNLYLGQKSGEYPPGVVPPHDYNQRFALLDAAGNNLTGFKYSNTGDFFNNFKVVFRYYYEGAGLLNQYGAEVLPTLFEDIILTDEGYAFVTIGDDSGNARVGYFKVPESWQTIRTASRPVTVYLNGVELYFDSVPTIKNNKTMVPLRKIFEALGATVEWDASTQTVTAVSGATKLHLTVGSPIAYVNGAKIQLDAVPFIQDELTFVPLRFVSEGLGADVKWDSALNRVIITTK